MQPAGTPLLGVLSPASMWATFVVEMAADAEGLARSKAPIKLHDERDIDEPTDVSHGHMCAGISGQVEQEVCYDASLFKPKRRRSLKVEGS
jgi:hypothetical protein